MTTQKTLDFFNSLKIGCDVDWLKTNNTRRDYQRAIDAGKSLPQIFKDRGFDHVRLRVTEYDTFPIFEATGMDLITETCRVMEGCRDVGLTAILAFQAEDWKLNPGSAETERVAAWWKQMAASLRGLPGAFNLIIETTLIGTAKIAELNRLYARCAEEIKMIDPDRVLIICPDKISDPMRLGFVEVPENNHVGLEAHFAASGFKPTTEKKIADKWTTGTRDEKDSIRANIAAMMTYRTMTGDPVWVGAISAGNYSNTATAPNGDPICGYTPAQQAEIAAFVMSECRAAGVPVAWNSCNKFFNYDLMDWRESMTPVVDAIIGA